MRNIFETIYDCLKINGAASPYEICLLFWDKPTIVDFCKIYIVIDLMIEDGNIKEIKSSNGLCLYDIMR